MRPIDAPELLIDEHPDVVEQLVALAVLKTRARTHARTHVRTHARTYVRTFLVPAGCRIICSYDHAII